jgi:histidinol phosphatase-like PHP family hydrolase
MIDLHTHSIFSDGELIPSELVRRAAVAGYRAIAITDHADFSNLDHILPRLAKVAEKLGGNYGIQVFFGVELTHIPPSQIEEAAVEARSLGAQVIVCHGETIAEPVAPGTNRAAILAGVDILAHPGLISAEEVCLAKENGVCLEISTRKGHSLCNGHVAAMARKHSVDLVVNTDSHSPGDLTPWEKAREVALGAGLSEEEVANARRNSVRIVEKILGKKLDG